MSAQFGSPPPGLWENVQARESVSDSILYPPSLGFQGKQNRAEKNKAAEHFIWSVTGWVSKPFEAGLPHLTSLNGCPWARHFHLSEPQFPPFPQLKRQRVPEQAVSPAWPPVWCPLSRCDRDGRHGVAWCGVVWHGVAWHGMALGSCSSCSATLGLLATVLDPCSISSVIQKFLLLLPAIALPPPCW